MELTAIRNPLLLRILGACVAVLIAGLLAADAAGAYGVRVEALAESGSKTVGSVDIDLAELSGEEDVRGRDYAVNYGSGLRETETITGFSLRRILEQAAAEKLEIDPRSVSYVRVSSQGGNYTVPGADLDGNRTGPPVVFADEPETAFLRPAESRADANGEDRLIGPKLLLQVRPGDDPPGPQPFVYIDASVLQGGKPKPLDLADPPVEVEVGAEVTFEGSLEGGPSGSDYSWTFDDDGSTATGERVSHKFARRGNHKVQLQVTTTSGQVYRDSVSFRVGDAADDGDGQGGQDDEGEGSLEAGISEPDDSGDTGGYTTPSYTAPSVPYVPPTGDYETPGGDYGLGGSAAGKPPKSPPGGEGDPAAGTGAPALDQVTGELLAPPVASPPAETETAGAPASAGDSDDGGVPGAAVGGLAVVGLLGLGALGEFGRVRPAGFSMMRVRDMLRR